MAVEPGMRALDDPASRARAAATGPGRFAATTRVPHEAPAPDGVVHVRFHGACHGCPSAGMTLQDGIERNVKERVPEITRVVAVQ